jgi:hypothetical protein
MPPLLLLIRWLLIALILVLMARAIGHLLQVAFQLTQGHF